MDVYNPDNSPNTDGFDAASCKNLEIIGTRISVGDDCIALKSGKIYMGTTHYRSDNDDRFGRNVILHADII